MSLDGGAQNWKFSCPAEPRSLDLVAGSISFGDDSGAFEFEPAGAYIFYFYFLPSQQGGSLLKAQLVDFHACSTGNSLPLR